MYFRTPPHYYARVISRDREEQKGWGVLDSKGDLPNNTRNSLACADSGYQQWRRQEMLNGRARHSKLCADVESMSLS